jgi:hypothetical protein
MKAPVEQYLEYIIILVKKLHEEFDSEITVLNLQILKLE